MSCGKERPVVYPAATRTRSEYEAVGIDSVADSDSDPERPERLEQFPADALKDGALKLGLG